MQRVNGFSLIELMIVVAIVAIIAAVAVPSYQSFVQEGRRAEAVALAMDIASRQERFYTQSANYTQNLTENTNGLGMASADSENGYYSATVTDIDGNDGTSGAIATYLIRVAPSGTFTDTDCHTFQLDNIGRRQIVDSSSVVVSGAQAAECWR